MGTLMATNLQNYLKYNNGKNLLVWNRTPSKAQPLKAVGARLTETVAHLVEESDIVFLMLGSDAATKEFVSKVKGLAKGKLIVDCSTVHPDTSSETDRILTQCGAHFIASPVFGATPVAKAAKLIFVPSGPKAQVDRIVPYMEAMGRTHFYLGTDVRKSLNMKITGNVFIVGLMELAAEVQVLGEKVGLSPEFLTKWAGKFAGPTVGMYFNKNSSGIYDPGRNGSPMFTVDGALKDTGHAVSLASQVGARLPVIDAARDHLHQAKLLKGDRSKLDVSAVYGAARVEAGLEFENDSVKHREQLEHTSQH
jgi:3-hydroxyisobutyrate dehydrogenase-like beta-hydroxyacid dehydrogenase